MKITFTKSHQSPMSGNELYQVGDQADLSNGAWLVNRGVAREGWHTLPVVSKEPEQESGTDLSDMTVVELQGLAREYGVPYAGLRKTDLTEALQAVM